MDSAFSDNSSSYGGAIYNRNDSSPTVVSGSTFSGNHARQDGGAIYNLGLGFQVYHSTFSGNLATSGGGGGFYNTDGDHPSQVIITNGTFFGNSAPLGGGIYNQSGIFTLENTIIANSLSGGNCYAAVIGSILYSGVNLSYPNDGTCQESVST